MSAGLSLKPAALAINNIIALQPVHARQAATDCAMRPLLETIGTREKQRSQAQNVVAELFASHPDVIDHLSRDDLTRVVQMLLETNKNPDELTDGLKNLVAKLEPSYKKNFDIPYCARAVCEDLMRFQNAHNSTVKATCQAILAELLQRDVVLFICGFSTCLGSALDCVVHSNLADDKLALAFVRLVQSFQDLQKFSRLFDGSDQKAKRAKTDDTRLPAAGEVLVANLIGDTLSTLGNEALKSALQLDVGMAHRRVEDLPPHVLNSLTVESDNPTPPSSDTLVWSQASALQNRLRQVAAVMSILAAYPTYITSNDSESHKLVKTLAELKDERLTTKQLTTIVVNAALTLHKVDVPRFALKWVARCVENKLPYFQALALELGESFLGSSSSTWKRAQRDEFLALLEKISEPSARRVVVEQAPLWEAGGI
eukprot:c17556_g1_i3.p1 GENE.c17556_g1_i3~~c17556_g1_i3.p1  ORF type:complete len:448 (+),score=109.02 c17556_g1_i3:62-1345(+)